jgi:hypothetical protein
VPDITFHSLAGGEVGPSYYGRSDQEAFFVSARLLYNIIAGQTGLGIGRGGTVFVAEVKDSADKILLVPFQFNEEQAYIAEFGDHYVRIYRNRGRQMESALNITGITQADPAVVTVAHALTKGKTVYIESVGGMTELNGNFYLVDHVLAASKNITAATRTSPVKITLASSHGYVGGEDVFIESVGGMTELNDRTFRLAAVTGAIRSIVGATQANPVVITTSGNHGLADGQTVLIENVGGMTELNGRRFVISPNYSATINVSAATKANPCVITTSSNHGWDSGVLVRLENLGGMVELNDREFTIGRSLQASKSVDFIQLTGTSPVTIWIEGHGYSTGDLVKVSGFGEAVELNQEWVVTSTSSDTFTLDGSNSSLVTRPAKFVPFYNFYYDAGTPIVEEIDKNKFTLVGEDSTGHTTYTSGGTAKRVNEDKFELDSEDGTGHTAYTEGGTATVVEVDDFYLEGENGFLHSPYTSGGTTKAVSRTSLKLQTLAGADVDSTGFGAYTSGGTLTAIHEVASPYGADDLFDANGLPLLQIDQSNDSLFIAHPDYHPRQLTRFDHDDWELTEYENQEGPFLDPNDTDIEIYATGSTGVGSEVTINSSEPLWDADHVGALWQIRLKDNVSSVIWTTDTAFTAGQEIVNGGKFYRCTSGGTSGTEAPTHDIGEAWDGSDTSTNCKWRYIHNGRGIVLINGIDSPSQVTAVVVTELPAGIVGSGNATTRWSEGAWSEVQGYPRSVSVHEKRLVWGGTALEPLAMDFSSTESLFYHNPVEPDGTVTRSTAFRRALDSNNPIRWMKSTEKGLLVGTLAGEWLVAVEGTSTQGFGADTAVARQFSANGAAAIQPIRNGDSVLYPARSRKRVRDITFSIDQQKLVTSDRNLRADHIAGAGVVAVAYTEDPHRVMWNLLGNGKIAALTYNREPGAQLSAWHRHTIGGSFGSGNAVVESIAVIPSPGEATDDLWLEVKRTINGATKRYIEYMALPLADDADLEDAIYPDCAIVYDGSPATTITGADHLAGEDARVFADGVDLGDMAVSGSGSVTLAEAASKVVIGLYEKRAVETVYIEAAPGDAVNTKMQKKRVGSVQLEVVRSYGGWVGTAEDTDTETNMDQMVFDEFFDEDGAPPLLTGIVEETINDDFGKRKFVRYEQRQAYPINIASITARFEVSND